MGKRNKTQCEDTQTKKKKLNDTIVKEIDEVMNDDSLLSTMKHKRDKKKRKEKNPDNVKEVLDDDSKLDTSSSPLCKLKRIKKNKKLINPESELEILDEDSKLDELVPQLEKTGNKKKSKKEQRYNTDTAINKSKKIVFVDDEPCEVPVSAETTNNSERKNKFLNDDEAEVKDEDIDKFCDELNEEDNKQYEDWVKLIEAKLHENKKSK